MISIDGIDKTENFYTTTRDKRGLTLFSHELSESVSVVVNGEGSWGFYCFLILWRSDPKCGHSKFGITVFDKYV